MAPMPQGVLPHTKLPYVRIADTTAAGALGPLLANPTRRTSPATGFPTAS